MEINFVIELLESEIDSMKDAYKREKKEEFKTIYSDRIVQCKRALKILKANQ